jgi:heptosyltransferase-1
MKILIIKSSALGDIIHSFDLVVYLKKKIPDCTIDWVVEAPFRDLVERHPFVDVVHPINSKKWRKQPSLYFQEVRSFKKERYDLIFDLQGNVKSSLLLVQAKGREKIGFGRKSVPEWPNLFFTNRRFTPPKGQNIRQDYLFLAQKYFGDFSVFQESHFLELTSEEKQIVHQLPRDCVLVAPSSHWPNKEVKDSDLIAFLETLKNRGYKYFLFTWKGQKEKERMLRLQRALSECSELLPELSLPSLQHLIARSVLVVAVDSVLLHLAGTTQTATISFFGPSSAGKYAPVGKQHITYQGHCPYGESFEKRCRYLRSCPNAPCCNTKES